MVHHTFGQICLLAVAAFSGCATNDLGSDPSAGFKIVETMNSGGYTYVKLDGVEGPAWFAVPECEVAVGDRVTVGSEPMMMRNFESRTLNRTFAVISFASGLEKVAR
tara:strand:+ start:4135 stop:4455 length:321 start_codon:yes stop_codon:yes gene_type:complete